MDLFVDLKVPAVGGSQWTTTDRQREEKSLCGNDLQTLLDFCGSPQIDTVERVKGIEPSYEAWEAAVLPLNYARVCMLFILLDALSKHKNSKRFFNVFFLNLRLLAPMD